MAVQRAAVAKWLFNVYQATPGIAESGPQARSMAPPNIVSAFATLVASRRQPDRYVRRWYAIGARTWRAFRY